MDRFGVSALSLMCIDWRYGNVMPSFEMLVERAVELGFDFVQGLPLRVMASNGEELRALISKHVYYHEGPWKHVSGNNLLTALYHGVKSKREDEKLFNLIMNSLFFHQGERCDRAVGLFEQSGSQRIGHDRSSGARYLEIHPDLRFESLDEVKVELGTTKMLVLDPRHLKDCLTGVFGGREYWQLKVVRQLAPYIGAVHVQPPFEEFGEFLNSPRETYTWRVIRALLEAPDRQVDLDFVAEYNPGLRGFVLRDHNDDLAAKMLHYMKMLAGA